jgi:hypothetical protein
MGAFACTFLRWVVNDNTSATPRVMESGNASSGEEAESDDAQDFQLFGEQGFVVQRITSRWLAEGTTPL